MLNRCFESDGFLLLNSPDDYRDTGRQSDCDPFVSESAVPG